MTTTPPKRVETSRHEATTGWSRPKRGADSSETVQGRAHGYRRLLRFDGQACRKIPGGDCSSRDDNSSVTNVTSPKAARPSGRSVLASKQAQLPWLRVVARKIARTRSTFSSRWTCSNFGAQSSNVSSIATWSSTASRVRDPVASPSLAHSAIPFLAVRCRLPTGFSSPGLPAHERPGRVGTSTGEPERRVPSGPATRTGSTAGTHRVIRKWAIKPVSWFMKHFLSSTPRLPAIYATSLANVPKPYESWGGQPISLRGSSRLHRSGRGNSFVER